MFHPERIKKKCEEKKISIKDLCGSIGITTAGFYRIIKTGEVRITTLEKISVYLNEPIGTWFDEDPTLYTTLGKNFENSYKACQREVEHLKEVIEIKDELLESLRTQLELKRQLSG
ncbi:MAG: helix-turn-helix domain-containing protein [Bacteroidales bacterium]